MPISWLTHTITIPTMAGLHATTFSYMDTYRCPTRLPVLQCMYTVLPSRSAQLIMSGICGSVGQQIWNKFRSEVKANWHHNQAMTVQLHMSGCCHDRSTWRYTFPLILCNPSTESFKHHSPQNWLSFQIMVYSVDANCEQINTHTNRNKISKLYIR